MQRKCLSKWAWASGLAIGAMSLPALATVTVDGTINESDYGTSTPGTSALSTQTITTSFGDNNSVTAPDGSELDAAYGVVENNMLYLGFTGNLQPNSNTLQIFIDDGRAGQNVLSGIPTSAGSMSKMNGSTFSTGFNATYALEINDTGTGSKTNPNGSGSLDQYVLVSDPPTATFQGPHWAVTNNLSSATLNSGIMIGYNDTNLAGIVGNAAGNPNGLAADQTAAQMVNTGVEVGIPLTFLGNPVHDIKVMALINGSSDSGPSEQFLPGLPVGSVNVKTSTSPYYAVGGLGFNFSTVSNEWFTIANNVVPNGIWENPGSGSWGDANNWSNNYIPNNSGDAANFSSATSSSDVTLDGDRTVGSISFNSSANIYSIDSGSGGTLFMDNGAGTASISDAGGEHIITAPVQLNSNTLVSGPDHGDVIIFTNTISGSGGLTTVASTISGTGFNIFSAIILANANTYQGPTTIQAGELQLDAPGALPIGTALTLDSPAPHGVLDLFGNDATVSSLSDTGSGVVITNDGGVPATFTYAGTNANPSTFDGTISDVSGSTTSLVIASGSLTLSGTHGYVGSTTVNSGATLIFSSLANKSFLTHGVITNNGTLQITGAGALASINGNGALAVSGQLQLVANSGVTQQTALTITGTLDITNNPLVIAFASNGDPLSSIQNYIASASDHGAWDGLGLTSSMVLTTPGTAVGYADGNMDSGTAAAAGTILVRYTWLGDLNLDGAVTDADLTKMTADNGMTNADWAEGDLNYDGTVNADDFGLLALGALESGGATLAVPEPASAALLAVPLLLWVRRRRSV